MDEPLTEASVRLAYKFILGRAPENDEVVRYAMSYGTVRQLRDAFLTSLEFEPILNRRPRTVRPDAPPLEIDWHSSDAAALAMLHDLRAGWDSAPAEPADDGAEQHAALLACLARNQVQLPDAAHAFELGCGAGRITAHLSGLAASVTASDAAPLQLAAAQRMAQARGLTNLTLLAAEDLHFGMLAPFDLWYSYHALHFSPPPLAARVLARAFALLRPGGIAVFQLISHAYGYAYSLESLPVRAPDAANERHVLPQRAVFALAAEAGCAPLEVFDDLSVAPKALWRSSMFVIRKVPA